MSFFRLALVAAAAPLLISCGDAGPEEAAASPAPTTRPTTAGSIAVEVIPPTTEGDMGAVSTDQFVTIANCAFAYFPETLAQRGWAFDGTLTATGLIDDSRLGSVPSATFRVNHWYRGGSADEVTVQYESWIMEEFAPSVVPGTRLLVTGEPRWGGEPLDDAVAWGCGFTQPWTTDAEAAWAAAFGTG